MTTKKAWDILRDTHEGDNSIKDSKHKKLTIEFENLKMYEHEKLVDFNVKFLKIASSTSYSIGKRIF